jgi:hypothetical protein
MPASIGTPASSIITGGGHAVSRHPSLGSLTVQGEVPPETSLKLALTK